MKKKNTQGYVRHKWDLLTDTIGIYAPGLHFSKHTTVSISGLQEYVQQFVSRIPDSKTWLIGFEGLPAVGKSSKVTKIEEASRKALWFSEPQELVTYNNPDGKVLEIGGYVCSKTNAVITTVHADHFFVLLDKIEEIQWWKIKEIVRSFGEIQEGLSSLFVILRKEKILMWKYIRQPQKKRLRKRLLEL